MNIRSLLSFDMRTTNSPLRRFLRARANLLIRLSGEAERLSIICSALFSTKLFSNGISSRSEECVEVGRRPVRLNRVYGIIYLLHPSTGLLSGEVGYAVPQLRPPGEGGGYSGGVDDAQDDAGVDAGVLQPLPGEPAVDQTALHPAVHALRHRPHPLVDDPLPLGTLHVDTVLHRQHVGRVDPALHPPPDDDVIHLPGLARAATRHPWEGQENIKKGEFAGDISRVRRVQIPPAPSLKMQYYLTTKR